MRAAMARRRGRRRRLRRGPDRQPPRRARRRPARQGGGPVRAVGHHVEPDLRQGPHPARRRAALRRQLPHLQLRGRRPGRAQRRHLPHPRRRLRHPRREPARGQGPARSTSIWCATRLVCLENTHNRGGGRVYPLEKIQAISAWAAQHGLIMHLDGARLWNAVVATGIPAADVGRPLRHRLGLLQQGAGRAGRLGAGRAEGVHRTARGASASCSAAACGRPACSPPAALYALDHHVERLAEDHRNAQVIAEAIADTPGLRLDAAGGGDEPRLVRGRSATWARRGRGGGAEGRRRAGGRRGRRRCGPARTWTCPRRRPSGPRTPSARWRRSGFLCRREAAMRLPSSVGEPTLAAPRQSGCSTASQASRPCRRGWPPTPSSR